MTNLDVRLLRSDPLRALELMSQLPGMDCKGAREVLALAKEIEMRQDLLASLERGLAQAITGEMLMDCMPVSSFWLFTNPAGGLEIDVPIYVRAVTDADPGDILPRDVLAAEVNRLMTDRIHGIVTPLLYPPLGDFLSRLEVPDYAPAFAGDTRERMLAATDVVYERCATERDAAMPTLIQEAVKGYIRHDMDSEAFFADVVGVSRQLYAEELMTVEPFSYAIDPAGLERAIERMAAKTVIDLDAPFRDAVKAACRAKTASKEPLDSRVSRVVDAAR